MEGRRLGSGGPLLGALAVVGLLASASVSGQAPDPAQGSVTVHPTADGDAATTIEGCSFYVRGHGVAGATGAIVFLYALDGAFQPAQLPMNVTGTANATGGFDFMAGPFTAPADDGRDEADLVHVNITVGDRHQEFSVTPDVDCAGRSTKVPFFASSWMLGLAAVGAVGAAVMMRRRSL